RHGRHELVMRTLAATVVACVLAAGEAAAQETIDSAPTSAPSAVAADARPRAWSCSASLFQYFVPDDQDYAQPTLAADHARLHLEARYNYEALETGSVWLGYALSTGEQWKLD